MYKTLTKPALDTLLALLGLLILSPVFVVLIALQFLGGIGRPFFAQLRPGKGGRLFKIIKFRSMTSAKDEDGRLLPDEQRLTKLGVFLRSTSLDELPQLINVLKGEMSLVGPRPLLPYYLDLYNDFQRRRNEVKPGITGWAQVNGRNAVPWEERFRMDVWYVENMSFLLDLKILMCTAQNIFSKEQSSDSDVPLDFPGNKNPSPDGEGQG